MSPYDDGDLNGNPSAVMHPLCFLQKYLETAGCLMEARELKSHLDPRAEEVK